MTRLGAASDAVYFPGPPKWKTDALIQKLQALLLNRVEQAYLFGSYARGTANADSDVDLIVVTPTRARWPQRSDAFSDLWEHLGPIDVLVYTPTEWAKMIASNHTFIEATKNDWIDVFKASI